MEEDYEQFWGRYFSISSPKPITETNPSISDDGNAFVYKSIFKDLSNYAIVIRENSYYILFEQNVFCNGKGTIYISGNSHFVNNHFDSFSNAHNNFIHCEHVNSTVTEGSISSCSNSNSGSLSQAFGKINIKAVNFSKCQSIYGSAFVCNLVQNVENISCCFY